MIICDPKLKLSIPTGVYRIQMGNIDQKSMTQKIVSDTKTKTYQKLVNPESRSRRITNLRGSYAK